MVLFVTSNPYVNDADRAILSNGNGFIDHIREVLPPYPRALFIAADPENREDTCRFGADTVAAFCEAGIPFQSYHILDGFNAGDAEFLIANSDLILLSGGHVPTQNDFFHATHLRELLAGFPGVVVGISAGSMNCADVVYVQPEEPGESSPDFPRWADGLGLTGVNILPHYQKVKDVILDGLRLFEDITYPDSMGNTFFALPDGSYFYQDEHCLLLCGEGYRLKDGILEQLTRDGDVLDMEKLN